MQPEDFIKLRPFAYHLTARANLPAIERTRRLGPAAAIFARANRPDLLRTRRRGMTTIAVEDEQVIIRDQDPLHPGSCAFTDGFSFDDLVELLNNHVYFWPGIANGPVPSGVNHFKRYSKLENAAVLRIPTANLFAANPTLTPHASAYNSGSPRCNPQAGGRKSPRGPDTFQPFPAFPHTPGKVIELTFKAPVTIPWQAVEVSSHHAWI